MKVLTEFSRRSNCVEIIRKGNAVVSRRKERARRFYERELLSGDRGAFQNGSARTRSDADAAHMRKASGIMQMRQTRRMQINEDACIRN